MIPMRNDDGRFPIQQEPLEHDIDNASPCIRAGLRAIRGDHAFDAACAIARIASEEVTGTEHDQRAEGLDADDAQRAADAGAGR